jgi:SPP1 gp7 family putative phage head morphogenesis protein
LNPLVQTLRPVYFTDVERQLRRIFYDILFAPLLAVIEKANSQETELRAATDDPIRDALKSGRIQYSNGIFSGEFNAQISKALRRIGALFDARSRLYRLDPGRVPSWIVAEATSYAMKAKGTHEELLRVLNETVSHLESLVIDHPVNPEKSINEIDRGFKSAAEQLQISPKLSDQARTEMKHEYTNNMKLWIDKFSREEITQLRQRVELNATQGYRFDRLIASIKNRYSVSENKATFLARQETSLFLAKFREKRFKDAGIRRYRWSTAHDDRVRHDHRHLNGIVFSYDEPPIVDQKTARRGNPGQDYNCRCVDIPVPEGLEK